MRYQGVIFDLDGVIVHTDEYHYRAWQALADSIGVPFDRETNNRLRGVSRMESLDIILERAPGEFTQAEKNRLADKKNELYRASLGALSPRDVDRSVLAELNRLKDEGYRLAIGSSSKNAGTILRNIGLIDLFDAVSDGNNITNSKPHPEVFLKAAEYLGLAPAQCVVVEDARAGVDAALAGGFACFGIGDAAHYDRSTWQISALSEMARYL